MYSELLYGILITVKRVLAKEVFAMISVNTAILALLIPVAVFQTFGSKQYGRKASVIQAAATVVTAVSGMLCFGAVLGSRVTLYECLFVNGLVSAALATLVFPVVQGKKFEYLQLLKFGCLVCIAVVSYSILTKGQTMIHGDSATASLLTKAQLEHGSFFPRSWYYVNGDIWILSLQTLVAPFVLLLKDQSLARMLGSLAVVLFTAWMVYLHSKKAYENDSWLLAVPLLFVFLSGERDMMLYQVAYTPQMVFLIAGMMWGFRVYRSTPRKRDYFCLGVLVILLVAGGVRHLAETVLPLWLTCMVLNYLDVRSRAVQDWKQIWKEWIRLTLAIMLPAVIGLAIHVFLKRTLHLVNSAHNSLVLVNSLKECADNVVVYTANLFDCFGFKGGAELVSLEGIWSMCSVVMCIIVVFLVPVLQAMKLKQEEAYVKFFYAFSVIHNLIMFVLAVFLKGKDESRYLLTSIFAWILLSSRYIYVYWIRQKHFEKYIWTGLFLIATVIGCMSLATNSDGWEDALASKEQVSEQLMEHGLTKGYGSFWTALGYEVYSDFGIQMGGLEMYDDEFIAHFWLIDGEVFTPEDTGTFLILTEEENQRYTDFLPETFEKPVDYFEINGNHIYVFDYDIAADMI